MKLVEMNTKLYLMTSKIYNAALRGIGAIEDEVEIVVMRAPFLEHFEC